MNNISGFIQPVYSPPNVVSIMPPAYSGRSDIMTIVAVSVIVVIVLFVLYRHMNVEESDEVEGFRNAEDPLTKCGWEVYVSPTCPYCVQQKAILQKHFPAFKNIFTDKPAEVVPTWLNTKTKEKKLGMQKYESLLQMAKCDQNEDPLTKCGWEVYVSPTCPYCVQQKAILQKHFPAFKNIFTDKPAEVVPTWFNTKTQEKKLGMQKYESLLQMAKC